MREGHTEPSQHNENHTYRSARLTFKEATTYHQHQPRSKHKESPPMPMLPIPPSQCAHPHSR